MTESLTTTLRALLDRATKRPWHVGHGQRDDLEHPYIYGGGHQDQVCSSRDEDDADLELIVTAINNLPALLSAAEAAHLLTDPIAVHANMLRGTIAKPSVEQIIHLYGDELIAKVTAEAAQSARADAPSVRTQLPPEPEMHANAEWHESYAKWHHRHIRQVLSGHSVADRARAEALEEAGKIADEVGAAWQRRRPENSSYTDGNRNAAQAIASAIRALGKETGQ